MPKRLVWSILVAFLLHPSWWFNPWMTAQKQVVMDRLILDELT